MKDYIERYHPEDHSSYDTLRRVVKEVWEAVGADELLALVREMPQRKNRVKCVRYAGEKNAPCQWRLTN